MYQTVEAFVSQVNIQQMDLPLASSVPWAPFSLMWAVHLASHVEEVFLPNIWELLPFMIVKPEFNVRLGISTTPPHTDVSVAHWEHTSLNLEKIIVFPARAILPPTLTAPPT